jgi:hypothetical protein
MERFIRHENLIIFKRQLAESTDERATAAAEVTRRGRRKGADR